jgi:cysteine synthase A
MLHHLIGNTPLIHLREISAATGCTILGKAEFLNPCGSVKDRTALGIIRDAEAKGELRAGGTIVEGTAGNTGIALTLLANALGYSTIVVMPQTQSREKMDLLNLYGADLRLVEACSYDNPKHYVHISKAIADDLAASRESSVIWAGQFDNLANRNIHYHTTGAEIWQQTAGKVDGFVCSVGTGGTLAGVSAALKERNPEVKIALADPLGSSLYQYYTHDVLESEGRSIVEGIGISIITGNLRQAQVDTAYAIADSEALPYVFRLMQNEGLCLGGSSAINMAGAVRLAKELGPGHTIVTMLCDSGQLYRSTLFNPAFLQRMALPVPEWIR